MERFMHKQRYRVGLNRISDAQRSGSSEQSEQDCKPFPAQSALQCIHWTSQHTTVLCLYTIFHSQQSLCIFRRNAEDASQPAPQYCARSAEGNSCCHAHNISRTYRRSKSRCQCAKLTYVASGIFIL